MGFILDNAKYPPTYVTIAEVRNLPAGKKEVVADIRKTELKGRILKVESISTDPNVAVKVMFKGDLWSPEEVNAMCLDHTAKFNIPCWSNFYLEVRNIGTSDIQNFAYRYGFWVLKPTIADKIVSNISLTSNEKELAEKHKIYQLIEKGVLPLTLESFIKQVYKPVFRYTISWHGSVPIEGVEVARRYSPTGTILVLEGVAMDKPPDATYTTTLKISVDEEDFLEMRAQAMSGSTLDVPLFVPAVDSFSLNLTTNMAISAYNMRYTFSVVRLTKFLELLFGIIAAEEELSLYERIRVGLGPV